MVFSLAESRGSCEACHIKRDYVYLALQSLHGSIVGAIPQQLNPYPKAPLVNTITRLNVHLLVPLTLDFRDKSWTHGPLGDTQADLQATALPRTIIVVLGRDWLWLRVNYCPAGTSCQPHFGTRRRLPLNGVTACLEPSPVLSSVYSDQQVFLHTFCVYLIPHTWKSVFWQVHAGA